jgi:hypothetical protein
MIRAGRYRLGWLSVCAGEEQPGSRPVPEKTEALFFCLVFKIDMKHGFAWKQGCDIVAFSGFMP